MVDEFRCDKHEPDRACFNLHDTIEVKVPRPINGRIERGEITRILTREDVWKLVLDMYRWDGGDPLRHVLFLGICPRGMLTRDMDEYIEQEMVCETYKAPPVSGGVDDWPAILYDAFLVIRQTHEMVKADKAKELRARKGRVVKFGG